MQSALISARPFLGLALVLGALSPFLLPHRASSRPVLSTTPINELYGESLVAVKVTPAVPVQDTRPMALQRGTCLDGRLRAAPGQHMAIAANPFEDVWRAPTIGGVNLALGTFEPQDVDIALPAEGHVWFVGRTYNARQESFGGGHRNSDGVAGANWFQTSQPLIQLYDDATDAKDVIYFQAGADRFAEYKRVSNFGTGPTYRGVNGAAGVFYFTDGGSGPDTWKLTDQHGTEVTFFGFDADAGAAAGQLWTIVDTDGNKAYVGDPTSASTAISNGYDSSGRMLKAYDTSDRRYTYTYKIGRAHV